MTSNNSVYSVSIGNSRGLVMTLSFMVMEADGSSSLIAMNILSMLYRKVYGIL